MLVMQRRLPVGAELREEGGVHFRVWAPARRAVSVVIEDAAGSVLAEAALDAEPDGYFSLGFEGARAGTLYRYRLDGQRDRLPDPASRFQPDGPHGPSQIVDPHAFTWTDEGWRLLDRGRQVLYEMHIGTFTEEGTWRAAAAKLAPLAELGITTLEVMPVADFPGRFGWGYDGVNLYAPTRLYGTPDDFRHFVNHAHTLGLGVILDVVYNHFGPDGNVVGQYAPVFFASRYENEWGDALNFEEGAAGVREFMAANAAYWIDEFHLDGLRFDATQQIYDASPEHVLAEIVRGARRAARDRELLLVAENEPQDVRLIRRREDGGFEIDALWNEDFHHASRVALTGRREAYCSDYYGSPQELVSLAKRGFLYQGQRYPWQKDTRGTPTYGIGPTQFVTFLQNHDQVANGPSGRGERIHELTSPGLYRALTAYWLLTPGIPMFFQGQEFATSAPFLYFADHPGALGAAVREGRATFLEQFRSVAAGNLREGMADPGDEATFRRCKLRHAERAAHPAIESLHRDLLAIRRETPVFRPTRAGQVDGAVLGPQAFVLRFFSSDPDVLPVPFSTTDRLMLVNLGVDLDLQSIPEPLVAPPPRTEWRPIWSSEDARYGGIGVTPFEWKGAWRLSGRTAIVLAPHPV
jgi:maltooligosyltrehalose trehalohydrolase